MRFAIKYWGLLLLFSVTLDVIEPEILSPVATNRSHPICSFPRGHVDGLWIKSLLFNQTPPCCSWDEGSNDDRCNSYSPAHPDGGFRGPDYYYAQSGGHACACTSQQIQDRLQWKPTLCILPSFNASRFCELLSGRTLLFVGDSTSDQAATALINSVRAGFGRPVPFLPVEEQRVTGCGRNIRFAVSDTLIGEKFGHYNRGRHWLEYARTLNVVEDIIILSGGPHMHSTPNMLRVLQQVISEHSTHVPQLRLIWRSQYPGGCGSMSLSQYPDDTFWKEYLNSGREIFSYADHRLWDDLAFPLFSNASENRFFLDISPLYLRPDSHVGSMPDSRYPRDCLHLCLPGPLHPFFAQILQHALENIF